MNFPTVDQLRREEKRLAANLWLRRLWPFGLALVMWGWGFVVGVRRGAPSEQDQNVVHAIQDVADSLKVVRARNDSLAHIDTVASAIAAAANDSVELHQPAVDSAAAAVTVSSVPTDSTVIIERPATDSTPARSEPLVAPLPVARYIRESKAQLLRFAIAVHDDTLAMKQRDVRIAELVHTDSLSQVSDSLHREHEKNLERERDSAFRRGVITGVKGTVKVLVVAVTAAKIIAVARK